MQNTTRIISWSHIVKNYFRKKCRRRAKGDALSEEEAFSMEWDSQVDWLHLNTCEKALKNQWVNLGRARLSDYKWHVIFMLIINPLYLSWKAAGSIMRRPKKVWIIREEFGLSFSFIMRVQFFVSTNHHFVIFDAGRNRSHA